MNLADALAQTAPNRGPRCGWAEWLAELDPTTAAQVQELLHNPQYQFAHLARAFALMDGGRKFDDQAIARHRRGECNSCAARNGS